MGLTFFGLTLDIAPEFRLNLFTQIHQIIFHGKGGYDWETIYNMPIWLRKFTFKQIKDFYDEEKKQMEEAKQGGSQTLVGTDGKVLILTVTSFRVALTHVVVVFSASA